MHMARKSEREARAACLRGENAGELAQAARLSQPVIARLESKKTSPQLDTLIRVAHALGCRLEVVRAAKE